jgi:hypothetical protein
MTHANLLDEPIIVESIHKASDELLRRSQSREKQLPIPATMLLSEPALAKDWDTDEENIAWASL